MGKKRTWQLGLIAAVLVLTVYNILPTLFYYFQPLKSPVSLTQAMDVAKEVMHRIDSLEEEANSWLYSYCELLQIKPISIEQRQGLISLNFTKSEEAKKFGVFFPKAGALILAPAAQLGFAGGTDNPKEVLVQRKIGQKLADFSPEELFSFAPKSSEKYRNWVLGRASAIRSCLQTPSSFKEVFIDWEKEQLVLSLKTELQSQRDPSTQQQVIAEVAKIASETNEELVETLEGYTAHLHHLPNTTGVLFFNFEPLIKKELSQVLDLLRHQWERSHPDLLNLPIVTAEDYETLSSLNKTLCVVVSPSETSSIRVKLKGIDRILRSYQEAEDSPLAKSFKADFHSLAKLLSQKGFVSYPASFKKELPEDYIFEHKSFSLPFLSASREKFLLFGKQKEALLEFSDLEQRILATNKIEDQIHEELLKWEDEYRSAQISIQPSARFEVAPPTRSPFLENIKLSLQKLWRGDERKILRWGLDLSGGKTIAIEFRDQQNNLVTEEAAIKQGMNELFTRVNKMGVSDVSIRQVGNLISLDFPGGQALSGQELVKASSMQFHVVNERFGPTNPSLALQVERFLQDVWNEAIVTNRKESEQIQLIAFRHLYGKTGDKTSPAPESEAARMLVQNGLKLIHPQEPFVSSEQIDESLCKVVSWRTGEEDPSQSPSHPLVVVFAQAALEGADLTNIQAAYDTAKGNYLAFEVQNSAKTRLFNWTSLFSKEKISGTARDLRGHSEGWRMAILLNGSVISAPNLLMPIRESASITGHFSAREIAQLASDLKGGSLTFTPHILSEKNVSPELGQKDRTQGIFATVMALLFVILAMSLYYRFAGIVASIAVLFNLLILWAILQNLGASLSLGSIAGIILTVGMAVDANVLVFERIKEEFSLSGNIRSAIRAGYQKAFSAILDSNITTIIAALILLSFDAGPIKAFAISMIIGIASSMFTALFMTRFYFEGWLQRKEKPRLSMAHWISSSKIDFLKRSKLAFATALSVICIGGGLLFFFRAEVFGMDFTGGYALSLELDANSTKEPLLDVQNALLEKGLASSDFRIRQHEPKTHLQILLGHHLEQEGKPFFSLPAADKASRIQWVITSLEQKGLKLTPSCHAHLDKEWTAMSGQMSEAMRNNALLALGLAFIAIFLYIAIRFEYKYAMGAILCLLHDVLITLGFIGLLYAFNVPVQIDLNTIAALMTIIGYSLNDTIIIFDRIREDVELNPHLSLAKIVNQGINTTLSRTSITSGTTLLVLIALLLFGGASIFSFALVMTIGVVFGTLSSWFIASPLMLFFDRKEAKKILKVS